MITDLLNIILVIYHYCLYIFYLFIKYIYFTFYRSLIAFNFNHFIDKLFRRCLANLINNTNSLTQSVHSIYRYI